MASKISKDIFIVATKRTPFGAFGGTLKDFSAVELGTIASKAAISQLPNSDASIIDSVVMGNVAQTTTDCAYLGRHVGLKSGVKVSAPMYTVNRLCGSGFQSIINGCQEIMLDESQVVLTGGCESMSMAPYQVHGIRFNKNGIPLGVNPPMVDSLWDILKDKHCNDLPMAMTAENLAEKYQITKEMSDSFAFNSQKRWQAANENGYFKNEIEPISIKTRKGDKVFDTDEHPRVGTTLESLAKLKPLFKKDTGVVSAGNASGIADGAGAVIIASKEAVEKNGLNPMARLVSYAVCGVQPEIMGFGPVPAMQLALEKANLTLQDMDLIEINEAFAAQFLACEKALGGLDMEKTNANGGAVAMAHPTGASGARIIGHLTYELMRTGKRYAIGSACIGGGSGIAIVIENPVL